MIIITSLYYEVIFFNIFDIFLLMKPNLQSFHIKLLNFCKHKFKEKLFHFKYKKTQKYVNYHNKKYVFCFYNIIMLVFLFA